MADLAFRGVSKVFDGGTVAVDALDLTVHDGEFCVFVGPSGSGKTTVLRMTAGLEDVSDGEIAIDGDVVNQLPPMDRDIAMVFQSYALYPHMNVADNMGFGLKQQRRKKQEIRDRVERAARILSITELLKRKPAQLSGGQRQRVAMGRALVREPKAFLMDEPLSNLDAKLRVQMRAEIQKLQKALGTTTLYVTHDQTEAMTMGDRVAVMRDGRLVQVDTPQALYDRPIDLFVARFIGSPAMNVLPALRLPEALRRNGRELLVGIRPEHLEDAALAARDGRPTLTLPVSLAETVGSEVIVHCELGDPSSELVARVDARTKAAPGRDITLAVDPETLYFFDPQTELAV